MANLTLFSRQGGGKYQHGEFPSLDAVTNFVNLFPTKTLNGGPFAEGCEIFVLDDDAGKLYWVEGLYGPEGFNKDFDETSPIKFVPVIPEFHETELKMFREIKSNPPKISEQRELTD